MAPADDRSAREVRLATGGPLPADWGDLTTATLKLRWAATLGYARRLRAHPPSQVVADAIIALAEALDRRGALLPAIPDGDRPARLAAAAQRLLATGTIAYAAGMPDRLRDLARADAATTVAAVLDDEPSVAELTVEPSCGWGEEHLAELIERARAVAQPAPAAGAPSEVDDRVVDLAWRGEQPGPRRAGRSTRT